MMKLIRSSVVILILVIAMVGCGGDGAKHSDEHGHAHDESLQLTAYSEQFEVFAEAVPFVVGHQSDILAHFTHVSNFKPLESGRVTVSLIIGTDGIRQTLEKPSRTGIYQFSLSPEKEGRGRLVFEIETERETSRVVVPNIQVFTDEHDAAHAAAHAAAESSNGAVFTKEQSWKVDFATEVARVEPFGQVIRATAQVLPSQGDERVVVARKDGVVSFGGRTIVEGLAVSAGQSLFSIDSDGMAHDNLGVRYSEAKAEYERAKAEYERKMRLAAEQIVAQSELLEARSRFAVAEADFKNLEKNFAGGRQSVSSPIGGYVSRVLVRNGEYVNSGQAVMVVSQNRDLLIRADLQPKYYSALSQITSANLKVTNNSRVYSLEELDGRVESYGKTTDQTNPLIPVTFRVRNTIGLLSGSFVDMYIKTQSASNAVTIPLGAIVEEMGNHFAFVQLTPEFFEKRMVETGATDGYRVEIRSGVAGGERVVSKGAVLVKLAQASGALDAHSGHVH